MAIPPSALRWGVGIYAGSCLATAWYLLRKQKVPEGLSCCGFDTLADSYDNDVGLDETLMGVKLLRWWLIRQAEGAVLEVSAGTGRNVPYYDMARLSSLTLTDTSKAMLWHARDKLAALDCRGRVSVPVSVGLGDAQRLVDAVSAQGAPDTSGEAYPRSAQQYAPHSFDTVVETFGLCSLPDPVSALQEMARACKPSGRLLLLDHGRANNAWLNGILDDHAAEHRARWGCWWNRDIAAIVAEAGLEVESMRRWHFGTTYCIVARPPGSTSRQAQLERGHLDSQ